MDYVLLSAYEASQLVNASTEEIVALVEAGELGGMRVAGQWRIPLKGVAQLLATDETASDPAALEQLFNDAGLWERVFSSHPEVVRATAGERSLVGVRTYLRRAISEARGAQGKPAAAD